MILDETPSEAAPRGVQRSLVILGFFVVLLAMLMSIISAQVAQPALDLGPLNTAAIYVLPALLHLGGVRLTYLHAATTQHSTRWVARRALYKLAAFVFLLNGLLMSTADTGVAGFLISGFFGALGPIFLAGLLDENAGVWLAHHQGSAAGPAPRVGG